MLKILEGTVASVPPQGGRKHPQQELIPIDTKNILFICGGAFDGLEKIIENRTDKKSIGFGATVIGKSEKDEDAILRQVMPQDLVKFGLIPEFIGRVPVTVTLDKLTKEDMIRILKEPKNALVKQYQGLLGIDGVELEFTDDAIEAIAEKSFKRKTGARGLRAIMEESMMDIMYEVPSDETIEKCIITKECVENGAQPEIVYKEAKEKQTKSKK